MEWRGHPCGGDSRFTREPAPYCAYNPKVRRLWPLAVLLLAAPAAASDDPADVTTPRVYAELPVLDLPFNAAHAGRWPSMPQSLWIAADAYEAMHTALRGIADPYGPPGWQRALGYALVGGVDLLTFNVPPLLGWQHEEWHRAVMSNRGISSFDDMYRFRIFATTVAVSHVRDEDLVNLKRAHPAEQVRLSQAGIEGNQELIAALERTSFFEGSRAVHTFLLPLAAATNSAYLFACDSKEGDDETDRLNLEEGTDIPRRDFTGLDCTGWVYDLFTPDEPYEARGVHPSGVGIDRYRKRSNLTDAGRRYLTRQSWFSLLNFADLRMYGVRRLVWSAGPVPTYWNLALRHLPAAFGYAFRGDLYLRRADTGLLASLYAYGNGELLLPGLDATLVHHPLGSIELSPRLALWLQPRDLRYFSRSVTPGGLAGLRLTFLTLPRVHPFVEVAAKTEGWVPGEVHLSANFTLRTGVSAWLF